MTNFDHQGTSLPNHKNEGNRDVVIFAFNIRMKLRNRTKQMLYKTICCFCSYSK